MMPSSDPYHCPSHLETLTRVIRLEMLFFNLINNYVYPYVYVILI